MKKSRVQFRHTWNYNYKLDTGYEENHSPSMTVPGESYSIQDLIQKHTSGIPVPVFHQGEYDDEPEHDDYDKRELMNADIVEQNEAIQEAQEKIEQAKEAIKKATDENNATKERTAQLEEEATKEKASNNSTIQEVEKQENE